MLHNKSPAPYHRGMVHHSGMPKLGNAALAFCFDDLADAPSEQNPYNCMFLQHGDRFFLYCILVYNDKDHR